MTKIKNDNSERWNDNKDKSTITDMRKDDDNAMTTIKQRKTSS